MGVHHAWGRAYKDLYQRFHAMLGEDQRYQNGFDCQGLWVEVNVERDLGFTSKRDIEAFGIAEFVTLCKQRVLTYAARQTEQSIRLGMWMDWNDPDELRRLRDLLGADPAAVTTIEGPDGPVTDTVEMLVGRLGMPDIGGSYFTFSNENNDLIWGFLAECHRRGWLYKGHDTMPWCARCGTGHLPDGDERGLPGPRRPGPDRPVPARRPAGRGAPRLDDDALDADLERRRGRRAGPALRPGPPGRRPVLARQGDAQDRRSTGPFEVLEEVPGRGPRRLALRGPVRRPAGRPDGVRRGHARRPGPRRTSTGSSPGTRSARTRAPASSTSPRAAAPRTSSSARRSGCRSSRRSTRAASSSTASAALTGRDVRDVAEPIVEHLKREGRFYRLETITHRYPHCWRCGTPLVFRLVDEWYISMGPVYDQPRETLTAEQVDASLRYQIMDVVDQIRWIPDFGYERELDWLRNMHDWMISKKRYWGLALPIYDCAACGTFEVIGGREELAGAGGRGLGGVRGPHAAPAVRRRGHDRLPGVRRAGRADQGRRQPVAGRRDRAVLDAPLPRGPGLLGGSGSRPTSSPRASPASSATGSTRCSRCRPSSAASRRSRRSSATPRVFGEDGRPMHKSWGNAIEFDEAAERMGVDVMRWMFAKARPEENILFGWHAADEARRELLVLWNVYAFFVTYARLAGWTPGAAAAPPVAERPRRSTAGSCRGPPARPPRVEDAAARLRRASARPARCRRFIDDLSTWYLRLSRRRFSRSDDRGRPGRGVRDAPRGARGDRPDARPDPAVPGRVAVREPRRRPSTPTRPTAST